MLKIEHARRVFRDAVEKACDLEIRTSTDEEERGILAVKREVMRQIDFALIALTPWVLEDVVGKPDRWHLKNRADGRYWRRAPQKADEQGKPVTYKDRAAAQRFADNLNLRTIEKDAKA